MLRSAGVLMCLVWLAHPALADSLADKKCTALDPAPKSQVSVLGTYQGQQMEFRITVDGQPVNLAKDQPKEATGPCSYTS